MVLPIIAGAIEIAEALEAAEAASALRTAGQVISVGSEIHSQYGNAVKAINAANMDRNPTLPSGLGKRPAPSDKPTTAAQPTVKTVVDASGGSSSTRLSTTNPPMDVQAPSVTKDVAYYDSHLLMTGESRLTKLEMKIGKQVYPDVITPFLKQLNGKGKIRMQFAGRCLSNLNKRHTHLQMFRHRLSATANYNTGDGSGAPYPPLIANNILTPDNTEPFVVPGGVSTNLPQFAAGRTPWRDIVNFQTYWAPYNLADLEDCSWNLNALKLSNYTWNEVNPNTAVMFCDNVGLFQTDDHSRMSYLHQNNKTAGQVPPGGRPAPYRYNAVLNHGSIDYNFMNKGTGGAKVEIIVYRVKKNAAAGTQTATATTLGNDLSYTNKMICNPIGAGYLETCTAKGGTDNLGGRPPIAGDVYDSAHFPFLPQSKRILQGQLPFAEVSRQTFAMPSGSRREITIKLPGDEYDPCSDAYQNVQNTLAVATTLGIFDPHSYGVMISCSGVPVTREIINTTNNLAYNMGDIISRCDVQFYGTYTEHLGACSYKTDSKVPVMFSQGSILLPDGPLPDNTDQTPITMVPQQQATRTPQKNYFDSAGAANGYEASGTNLTNEFHSVPPV